MTSKARFPRLPNVPSIQEAGYPNAVYNFWVGLFVTAKTPKPVIEKVHTAVMKVMEMPEVKERFEKLGASPMPMGQSAFEKYLDDETKSAATLVKAAGIKVE